MPAPRFRLNELAPVGDAADIIRAQIVAAMSRRTENGSRQSGARMGKDGNRSDNENYRNDYSAVAINSLRSCDLLIVIENCRDQNFDQRKENEQGAD